MDIQNSYRIKYLLPLIVLFFIMSCQKETDPATKGEPALSFVESTIPGELSADGGMTSVNVSWAYTKWNVSAGEVLEGKAFVTDIKPSYAGDTEKSASQTKVNVTFDSNETYSPNSQELILRSLTEDLSDTIVIKQAGKPVEPIKVAIDPSVTYQTISGFGGGNMMWGTDYLTASQIKSAFGTGDDELGLTILRIRLSPVKEEWSWVLETAKEAKKYGAKILASPWSPPASLKSNNDLVGGHLLEENYAAYATYLNDFVQYMASEGVTIDAVSIQNEPDWNASYESCEWTQDQMFNFIKNNASAIQGTKVAAAESLKFNQAYTDKILNDPVAADNLDIAAGHLYGGGLAPYPLAEQKDKEIWMTEYLLNLDSGNDPNNWDQSEAVIWDETLQMLGTIHDAMEYNWNAYIWWYVRRYYSFLGDGEHGTVKGAVLKRGYAMSQYSRFVRPGYVRVKDEVDNSSATLKITTYKGDNKIIAVIINPENAEVPELNLSIPQTILSAETYTTSVVQNRAKEVLNPADKSITVKLKAKSITTIVLNY